MSMLNELIDQNFLFSSKTRESDLYKYFLKTFFQFRAHFCLNLLVIDKKKKLREKTIVYFCRFFPQEFC
jgi:hypothetical protein